MASELLASEREPTQVNAAPRRPRILLAASGSVASIKFGNLCHSFAEWAEVRAVATRASLHFIDRASLPKDAVLYTDDDEWSSWNKIGDSVLHIELRRWADIMVIAPLSANTLGKVRAIQFQSARVTTSTYWIRFSLSQTRLCLTAI